MNSLRSRRLEVVAKERTGARKGDARVSFSRAFSFSPTSSKRLLRRLIMEGIKFSIGDKAQQYFIIF